MSIRKINGVSLDDRWRDALVSAGLDSFDALFRTTKGACLSLHEDRQTRRIELPEGALCS